MVYVPFRDEKFTHHPWCWRNFGKKSPKTIWSSLFLVLVKHAKISKMTPCMVYVFLAPEKLQNDLVILVCLRMT